MLYTISFNLMSQNAKNIHCVIESFALIIHEVCVVAVLIFIAHP